MIVCARDEAQRRLLRSESDDVHPWSHQTLLSFDLETTGLDPGQDRIVQAAVILIDADGGMAEESWDGIVNPGVPIPEVASKIHGITNERAQREGLAPAEALGRIARLINRAASDGIPLVIYNAPFDWPFVLAEARRHGVLLRRPDIIDPLVMDRGLDRYRRGGRKLDAVAAHYGYTLAHAHDARADALAAATVARALAQRYPEVGDQSPVELQLRQARWCAEHAESLSRHLGKPIDPGWPVPQSARELTDQIEPLAVRLPLD